MQDEHNQSSQQQDQMANEEKGLDEGILQTSEETNELGAQTEPSSVQESSEASDTDGGKNTKAAPISSDTAGASKSNGKRSFKQIVLGGLGGLGGLALIVAKLTDFGSDIGSIVQWIQGCKNPAAVTNVKTGYGSLGNEDGSPNSNRTGESKQENREQPPPSNTEKTNTSSNTTPIQPEESNKINEGGSSSAFAPNEWVEIVIKYGSENEKERATYGDQTGKILSYINGRSMAEIRRIPEVTSLLTPSGRQAMERLLQNRIVKLGSENLNPIVSYNGPNVQVRPIPVLLIQSENAISDDPLYVTFVFNDEKPPKLVHINYDLLAYFVHLASLKYPLPADSNISKDLRDFLNDFIHAYNNKKIDKIREWYAQTADIIVSKKVGESFRFNTRDKEEYLHNLERIFDSNNEVQVNYSNPSFWAVPNYPNKYIIDFDQQFGYTNYDDAGRVILCVEFDRQKGLVLNRICNPFIKLTDTYQLPQPPQAHP